MSNTSVSRAGSARIPTEYGEFQLVYYDNTLDDKAHLAFYMGELSTGEDIIVRLHSECRLVIFLVHAAATVGSS